MSGRQWQRVFRYVFPALFLSVAFNLPKFFELRTQTNELENPEDSTELIKQVQKRKPVQGFLNLNVNLQITFLAVST